MQEKDTTATSFLGGLVIGVLAMILLGIHTRPLYRDALRSSFIAEQDLVSDLRACEGDLLGSVVHRWSALEAESDPEVWPSVGWSQREIDPLFAFRLLWFEEGVSNPSALDGQGQRAMLGTHRADLAARLELIGQENAAKEQWELAEALTGLPEERLRERAFARLQSLREIESCRLVTAPAQVHGR
jgi:hypothetical protein